MQAIDWAATGDPPQRRLHRTVTRNDAIEPGERHADRHLLSGAGKAGGTLSATARHVPRPLVTIDV